MSKVMIVEDDDSLRQIYSIRLTAEGYTVVAAADGEAALAMAVSEKPDLILSDVMMPKISGFDMLDILRSSPETANVKVIMMTALSSDDQRERGEQLGADRYLVKSQVGIEDVVNVVKEVLAEATPVTPQPAAAPQAAQTTQATPVQPTAPVNTVAQPAQQPVAQPAQPAMAPAQPATPVTPTQAVPVQSVTPQQPMATQSVQPAQPVNPGNPNI